MQDKRTRGPSGCVLLGRRELSRAIAIRAGRARRNVSGLERASERPRISRAVESESQTMSRSFRERIVARSRLRYNIFMKERQAELRGDPAFAPVDEVRAPDTRGLASSLCGGREGDRERGQNLRPKPSRVDPF